MPRGWGLYQTLGDKAPRSQKVFASGYIFLYFLRELTKIAEDLLYIPRVVEIRTGSGFYI